MKIAGIQHEIIWENPKANFSNLQPMINEAAEKEAELIVLSELFSTGFSMDTPQIGEMSDGPSVSFLSQQACRIGIPICGSVPLCETPSLNPTNCLIVAHPDGSIDKYAKKHLFSFAGEDKYYAAGTSSLTLQIGDIRISFFVCFDLRFAPEFWNLADETDLFVIVANWPEERCSHWKYLLRARAIENQSYVLGVNRVGDGNGISYSGDSCLIDPLGENVVEASPNLPSIILGEIDKQVVVDTRHRFPFLNDR